MTDKPNFYTVADVAAQLGCCSSTVHAAIRAGDLPATNIAAGRRRHWRIAPADLAAWLATRKAGAK